MKIDKMETIYNFEMSPYFSVVTPMSDRKIAGSIPVQDYLPCPVGPMVRHPTTESA
jgi:hypothetical protein